MQRLTGYKIIAHSLAALPFVLLLNDSFSGGLGADPVHTLTLRTGWWALTFLLLCLTMTPMRLLSNAPIWIRFRRLQGLWAFAFASCHLCIFVVLDLQGEWRQIFTDVFKRPYITLGFCAWLLLLPLACTSTHGMMRKLGRRWHSLHQLVYVIALLGVLHFFWLVKKDLTEPVIFAALFAALMGTRVGMRLRNARALAARTK
jgi:methionine sulfoxide reductase heme-binding subunit